ncbi:MAG: S-layer homology domain-containing protein [Ruminococcaceae bacterium]|nr:S-layer homology domain-containing protein [Oscillospiraceae bacterium]
MKKVLVLFLTALMVLSTCAISVSAMTFTDMNESHWAYANVQTLVNDGTVKGYEDGSFKPEGTVTRAEFVKMLGVSSVVRSFPYSDVSADHWAYTYIMAANFPEDGSNLFMPSIPITRGLVAELLWRRAGQPTDVFAPSIISEQYKANPTAAAWVYATGLIRGDGDGITLRLSDTLTRAEAATLIVRARSVGAANGVFAEIVDQNILVNVYNGLNLFDDISYDATRTITNGEMARAALRIGKEQHNLAISASPNFEHPYAKETLLVFNALGKNDVDAAFADKTATFGDTVAALTYHFIDKAHNVPVYGNKTESLSYMTNMMNVCLTFAKDNGVISLKEDLNAPVTLRDFTAICLLYDYVIGSQSAVTTDPHPATGSAKKDQSLLLTAESYGDYQVKVAAAADLYAAPFNDMVKTPKETYDFAREYNSILMTILQHLRSSINTKANVRLTYYPSLVCKDSTGYTMRVACEIVSMNGSKSISELLPVKPGTQGADAILSQGDTVYFDLASGSNISSVSMTSDTAFVSQIIKVVPAK